MADFREVELQEGKAESPCGSASSSRGNLVITRTIKPESEEDYKEWVERIQDASRIQDGFVQTHMYPPNLSINQDFWTHVIEFASIECARNWTESQTCKDLWNELEEGGWVDEESLGYLLTDPQVRLEEL